MRLRVTCRDPFMRLLQTARLDSFWRAVLAMFSLFVIGVGGLCALQDWVSGATGGDAHLVQLLHDPVSIAFMGIFAPLFVGYSVRLHEQLTTMFEDLRESGAWAADDDDATRFVRTQTSFLRSKWPTAIAITIPLVCDWGRHVARFLGIVPGHDGEVQMWNGICSPSGVVTSVLFTVFFYSLAMVVMKSAVAALSLCRLFAEPSAPDIRFIPLHEDRCGGLSPIGNAVKTIGVLMLILGLSAAAYWTVWDFFPHLHPGMSETTRLAGQVAFVVAYLLGGYALVWTPLSAAHRHMAGARDRLAAGIARHGASVAEQLDAFFAGQGSTSGHDTKPSLTRLTKTLTALEAAQAYADRMPVWPVATREQVRMIGAVVAPLLIMSIETVVGELV